jgi:hypothetical protein
MKTVLIIVAAILCCQCIAQKSVNEFAAFEKKVSKEFKIKELKKCKNFERCLARNKELPSPHFYEGFHFVDFDNDGKIDIVGDADCGNSESNSIYLFKNKGTFYEIVYMSMGAIINPHFDSSSKMLAFTRWEYPCCADNQNMYEDVVLLLKKGKLTFVSGQLTCFISGTEFPLQMDSSSKQEYETILETYKLRGTPAIDDNIKLYEEDDEKGNVIAAYPKHSVCIKLAEATDKDGKVWWFVKMRNNMIPTKNRIYRGDDKTPYNSFGWLSSRFLKKLD